MYHVTAVGGIKWLPSETETFLSQKVSKWAAVSYRIR